MLNYGIKILDTHSPHVQKAYKKLKSRGAIKLLSEIWDIKKPSAEKVRDIFVEFKDFLKKTKEPQRKDTILKILEYLQDNTGLDLNTWKKSERLIMEEGILTKGGVMDIREHIKEKGRWEGRQEGMKEGMRKGVQKGRQEVALNMLENKFKPSVICKITGLSENSIKKLKNGS